MAIRADIFSPEELNMGLPKSRALRYLSFGILGLSIDYSVFALLILSNVSLAISSGVGYLAGTLITFGLNARFNFRISDCLRRRALRFLIVGLGAAISSSLFIDLVSMAASGSEVIIKVLVTTPFLVVQYLVNSRWTFRPKL